MTDPPRPRDTPTPTVDGKTKDIAGESKGEGVGGWPTAQLLQVITSHFRQPTLSLSMAAATVGISTGYASRAIKRSGQTFLQHVHAQRTAAAAALLIETNLSIKEIANHVGYAHTNQLDRHFRRHYGSTPSIWRRNMRIKRVQVQNP